MYISITGLIIKKSLISRILFYRYAIPCFYQAKKTEGNLSVDVKTIKGVHHTVSLWKTKENMQKFVYSGAHMEAIKKFSKIATGKTFGYSGNTLPSWTEVHEMWKSKAKSYDKS